MAVFTVSLSEEVMCIYGAVTVEAADEAEARERVEEMRAQGELGAPKESVERVHIAVRAVALKGDLLSQTRSTEHDA